MKFLITTLNEQQLAAVKAAECEVIATYPKSILARCDNDTANSLRAAGLELSELPTAAVTLAGRTFSMDTAAAAEAPAVDDSRKMYYVAQLAGPVASTWISELENLGVEVIGTLQGFVLVLKLMPSLLDDVRQIPWVETISPYHSILKLSSRLALAGTQEITASEFSSPLAISSPEQTLSIEITTFPGEDIEPVLSVIREAQDTLISYTATSAKALVKRNTIERLVNHVGVQVIQPFAFPTFDNDVAREILNIPSNNVFSVGEFRGEGQIVAVCDSGLDTGDIATMHLDLRGRVDGISSLPTNFHPDFAPYINGSIQTDDGPDDSNSGHGTHVAGSVAGNGEAAIASGSNVVPLGVAPEARIFFQAVEQEVDWKPVGQLHAEGIPVPSLDWPPRRIGLYGLPEDLNDLIEEAYNAGARIHTNSWGAAIFGEYNGNSREVDGAMSARRDMLVIFSAGNEGRDLNGDGLIDPDSVGSPGTAKNCLTVGASENDRPSTSIPVPGANTNWTQFGTNPYTTMGAAGHVSDNPDGMACFSSRGPVDGGRIKPEAVAPGTNILSLRTSQIASGAGLLWGEVSPSTDPLHGAYCWSGGTSMSTPVVAGLAALVRQALIVRHGHHEDGTKPSGALVKACLLNGSIRIGGQFAGEVPTGTNSVTGFGRVSAASIIDIAGFDDEPESAVGTGDMRTYQLEAIDKGEPIRVTLCWTDPPSPGAGQLQNTLYLQVQTPDGSVLDGDIAPFPIATNNSQQIEVSNSQPGTYTVRVRGVSVTQQAGGVAASTTPTQDFAIAYSNATPVIGPSS